MKTLTLFKAYSKCIGRQLNIKRFRGVQGIYADNDKAAVNFRQYKRLQRKLYKEITARLENMD